MQSSVNSLNTSNVEDRTAEESKTPRWKLACQICIAVASVAAIVAFQFIKLGSGSYVFCQIQAEKCNIISAFPFINQIQRHLLEAWKLMKHASLSKTLAMESATIWPIQKNASTMEETAV